MGKRFTGMQGDAAGYLGRQFENGKLVHYRGVSANFDATIERTKLLAENPKKGSEYQYLGTVRREVIDDWLRTQEKDWHDFATDEDLKAKFMRYYKDEYSKMIASTYVERKLSVNRTTAPKLGATILNQYRKEMASAI